MIELPEHKCGLHLEHNVNRDYYQSVADYIDDYPDLYNWPSEDEKRAAIESNELWTLQWYPETPIGFYAVAAATLETLLEFANQGERQ